ncbi:hypothetical protein ABW19_dt0204330 [Dactylella cylindrospora]|nr:hypothetical protein ABW19_dt0204330 [Dactylella cylindrospora]
MPESTVHGVTTEEFGTLKDLAAKAKEIAYCPYSKFRVGCALLCEDGSFVVGANIENASYPVGTCAERAAISKAVIEGHTKYRAVGVCTDISPPGE